MLKINKTEKRLLLFLIISRVLFFIILYFIVTSSPIQKILPFKSFFDFLLTFAKRWDGNSYTFIADHGYVLTGPERTFIVFPPLYPLLIKSLTIFGMSSVVSGILVSNSFFALGMLALYKLFRLDYTEKFSLTAIILISIFPTTFFFSVAYPESLYVFLFAISFYLYRKNRFLLAGLAGGLAAITRPFGEAIFPAIVIGIILSKNFKLKNLFFFSMVFIIFPLYYLLINYLLFANPFEFSVILKENWYKSFAWPWNGIISSLNRGLNTKELDNSKFLTGYGEAFSSIVAWIASVFGIKFWKKIQVSYLIYLIVGTIMFTSTSFILSAPRYLLSLPPFFIILTKVLKLNKVLMTIWVLISIGLLFYIANEFAWGHWTF